MAASVLAAFGFLDEHILSSYLLLGEVGLNGSILPTKGVLSAAVLAQKEGMQGIVVPWEECQGSSNPGYCKSDSGEKFKRVCADLSAGIAGNLLLPGTARISGRQNMMWILQNCEDSRCCVVPVKLLWAGCIIC